MRLWMLLVPLFIAVVAIMGIATKLRGAAILNAEDHRRETMLGFLANFCVFAIITAVTPVELGIVSAIGLALLLPAAILYIMAIVVLTANPPGLVTEGIYRYSRNPMYVAMIDLLVAFSLIAFQSRPVNGLALLVCTAFFALLIRTRVRDEERFLSGRYPNEWARYCRQTARYLPGKIRK